MNKIVQLCVITSLVYGFFADGMEGDYSVPSVIGSAETGREISEQSEEMEEDYPEQPVNGGMETRVSVPEPEENIDTITVEIFADKEETGQEISGLSLN